MLNSLNEPTRWRNHSRATKSGARTWKRNELCSNGVPCRSRRRKRIRPWSLSSISSLRRAKLTRAALTTERSSAIESSRRTNPWSRTRIVPSAMTSEVAATEASVTSTSVGTSGWGYPSWKPGFYPGGTQSWDGIEPRLAEAGAVRVNDLETEAPFRYVRLREPPYSDDDLREWADRLREVTVPTFVYLRHEDEPSAPRYAQQLRKLLVRA